MQKGFLTKALDPYHVYGIIPLENDGKELAFLQNTNSQNLEKSMQKAQKNSYVDDNRETDQPETVATMITIRDYKFVRRI